VMMARALLVQPRLLIADEPTSCSTHRCVPTC
jgi:ABC-type glutathione transport system ATPase component